MLEAVFISDLHLHPQQPLITLRFNRLIEWVAANAPKLYILGDFFHMWAGDDMRDAWSLKIIEKLRWLAEQGVSIYFMHGNRDFLLGKTFAKLAQVQLLADPTLINLGEQTVLLSHGDRYCLLDKAHQRFRRLTRNRLFKMIFLLLPLAFRLKLVNHVRTTSQNNRTKPAWSMDVVPEALIQQMKQYKTQSIIHGHTHQPGSTTYMSQGQKFTQWVLSDWDDIPQILCYYSSKGFQLEQKISTEENYYG